MRPGEKLYEELLADDEATLPTPHPKLRIAKLNADISANEFSELLAWLGPSVRETASVKHGLKRFVPEYVTN